ncbi:PREDICTED: uncharacterized protein LOC108364935 [Rhagoletis zephyria]|uniref:uncharacterized protein LOC108364935 n=1 Tax=Rhagoletis zephyria TaxID=28612 RepID=UPI0008117F4F|nr:PREDICTED: uncharacterized protein LOC108364935 [Rhagoletis zephyria]
MFDTVVHQDVDLTRIEKFQHLRLSLRDAALDTIRSLEISEPNYDKAICLLKARFNNKRLNFQARIRDIVQLKRVEGEKVAKLRELSDALNAHLRALQTVGTKEQIADCLLIQLVSQKLDIKSRAKWEEQTPANEIPTWDSMATFLEQRCQRLENVENALATPEKQVGKKLSYNNNNRKVSLTSAAVGCTLCSSSEHRIANCERFLGLSPLMRYKEAKRLHLCLNCLRRGHSLKDCKSGQCRHCSSKHHSLLHQDTNSFANSSETLTCAKSPSQAQATTMLPTSMHPYLPHSSSTFGPSASALVSSEAQASFANRDFVLLATAIIYLKNRSGSLIPCRALLDSASQLNFVTNRLVSQLQLKKVNSSQFISGIGQNDFATNHIVDLRLHSRVTDYTANLTAVVTSTITDIQPSRSLKCVDWNIPSNIRLADPLFFEPQRIDMLIGASLFFDLLCVGQIRLAESMPILQKTKLGWIVSGATAYNAAKLSCLTAIDMALTNDSDVELNKLVERFWEVETCKESSPKTTAEEDLCEAHFLKNYRRLKSGEFSVRLPTKLPSFELGESYQQAVNRFRALERRLQRNAELKKQYSSFIKEYLDLNHMSVVDAIPSKVPINFLPHHCVLKADSTTTKLRVVFDGSAPTSTGRSLNSILMKGPTIQQQLFDILL